MAHRQRMNQYNENEDDRAKFLGYITLIITDYAKNNRIDPARCML